MASSLKQALERASVEWDNIFRGHDSLQRSIVIQLETDHDFKLLAFVHHTARRGIDSALTVKHVLEEQMLQRLCPSEKRRRL